MFRNRTSQAKTTVSHRLLNGTRLNIESLEERCMLSVTFESSETDTSVLASAQANGLFDRREAENFTSAQAGQGGALGSQTSVANAVINSQMPSLGINGYTYGRVVATDGNADVGEWTQEPPPHSNSNAHAEFRADCNGLLHVVIMVSIEGGSDASPLSPFGGNDYHAAASGGINGSISVGGSIVGEVTAGGSVYSDEVTDTSQFTITATGPDGALPTVFAQATTPPASGRAAAILSFSVEVFAGQLIRMQGGHAFRSVGDAIDPISGTAEAFAWFSGNLSVSATLECLPTPPPDPPGLPVWSGIILPGETSPPGPLSNPLFDPPRFGDFDGDGDMDDTDLAAYLALFRTEQPLVVTTQDDELDDPVTNPAGYAFGDLSLREALALAADSNHPGVDSIGFAPWIRHITLNGTQLSVNSDVNIVGLGVDRLSIDANNGSRVLWVNEGVAATISGLTVTGGQSDHGAGIYNVGALTLISAAVIDNVANTSNSHGGGIYVGNAGTGGASLHLIDSSIHGNQAIHGNGVYALLIGADLTIERSTVSDNHANNPSIYSAGGGLAIASSSDSTINIVNSTFSGNSAYYSGGIRFHNSAAPASIINTTIADNNGDEGGGIDLLLSSTGPVSVHNSIVAENKNRLETFDSDVWGYLDTSSSYNLIGRGGAWGFSDNDANYNIVLASVESGGLAPLGDYGGKTKTHALLVGSQALDTGNDTIAGTKDQRGFVRPVFMPPYNPIGGNSDRGAFEAGISTPLTVMLPTDRNNSLNATATIDSLSLREAIALSALLAGTEKISFDPELFDKGLVTIKLTEDGIDSDSVPDQLLITSNLTIAGPGADLLAISGDDVTRVFEVASGVGAEFCDITITHGLTTGKGGGIYTSGGGVALLGVRVTDNSANLAGGGISSLGSLRIVNSEISDNTVTGAFSEGAGIHFLRYNDTHDTGPLQIINTTISGNQAIGSNARGGGIYADIAYIESADIISSIVNSTIAFNFAYFGGGAYLIGNTGPEMTHILLHNSIVAGNWNPTSASDIYGHDVDNRSQYNLIGHGGDGGLANSVEGPNFILTSSQSAGLTSLGFHGGRTRTHALLFDSLAIDNGDYGSYLDAYSLSGVIWDLSEYDQRGVGYDRILDGDGVSGESIDIGAYERAFEDEWF